MRGASVAGASVAAAMHANAAHERGALLDPDTCDDLQSAQRPAVMQGVSVVAAMHANATLELAYERDALLEKIRALRRLVKSLRNDPLFDDYKIMHKWYIKYSIQLLKAEALLEELFPPSLPPVLDLAGVRDHHADFRFAPGDLDLLARHLLPSGTVRCVNGAGVVQVKATSLLALCVVLRHLASPEKLKRQAEFWCKSTGWVSHVVHTTSLRHFRAWPRSHLLNVARYCDAMSSRSRGACYSHALIDRSSVSVSRPKSSKRDDKQRDHNSGDEGTHCLNLVAAVSLCGLFVRVWGPFSGALSHSKINSIEDVEGDLTDFHARASAVHTLRSAPVTLAYSCFPQSRNVYSLFAHAPDGGDVEWKARHNLLLSLCRVPNEWAFGRCRDTWHTLANTDTMSRAAPEKEFLVAMFLTNCKVCSEGSQHEQHFGFSPPSLEAYLKEAT